MINIKLQKEIQELVKKVGQEGNGGYTFLFAVLVSSLVLAIGIAILNVSKKEFLLATSARDSSSAFYASDGGIECALYEDIDPRLTFEFDGINAGGFNCVLEHSAVEVNSIDANGTPPKVVFTFHARFGDASGTSCAVVIVTKTKVDVDNGIINTKIHSSGYNSGWNESDKTCSSQSAKRVERGIDLSY